MTPPDALELPRFAPTGEAADLCVVLVNYNTAHLLDRCLGELRRASVGLSVRVVIVDNASRDGSADFIRKNFPDCILIANTDNVGFGRANNQALAFANAPYVLLLNADAFVRADTLVKSLAHMKAHPRCGVLGAQLVDESGRVLWGRGRSFPNPWKDFLIQIGLGKYTVDRPPPERPADQAMDSWACDWVVGCYYLIRQEVIEQIGLFDPRYFLYYEVVDHCRAVHKAGWSVESLADVEVVHVGGGSAETEGELSASGRQISALQIESELLYFRKHNGLIGLAVTVGLSLFGDAIRAFKWLVKGRALADIAVFWRHSATVCRLVGLTRLGTRATR